jgi:NTP pyrophosphatase (non-canonical NTP hydrolase)
VSFIFEQEKDKDGMLLFRDLDRLQVAVNEWARRNFPKSGTVEKAYRPLLGMGEEIGEVMHAHLKSEQGIRESARRQEGSTQLDEIKDGLGDVLIFMLDYCNHLGISLSAALRATWDEVKVRDWIKYPETGRPPKEATAGVWE